MTARPTTLRLLYEHCPHAVTLYEQGAPQDRAIFAVGTAAHEVLDAIARYPDSAPADVAERVCRALIATGRGGIDAEGPMDPAAVFAGRDLALEWLDAYPVPAGASSELGLGFGRGWRPEPYESASYFRCRTDLVPVTAQDDGDDEWPGLCVLDYKTSWQDREGALDTIQRRGQAVAVWLRWRDLSPVTPAFIRVAVGNLRARQIYHRDLWLHEPADLRTLREWQRDLETLIAAHETGTREARPGIRCHGCPYILACEPAREYLGAQGLAPDRYTVVSQYVVARARADALEAHAREVCADDPVSTSDGLVGYVATTGREPVADVGRALWREWAGGETPETGVAAEQLLLGLLAALAPGVTSLGSVAKALTPRDKATRDTIMARLTRSVVAPKWKVQPPRDGGDHKS